jgi:RHS repeat-associated protein
VLVTNPNGNPVRRRVFEPFGKVIDQTGSETPEQLFTGQRHEPESGLYDFRARWYDPEAGRFLSVDPVVQSRSDPQTVNGYGYVRNNPVRFVDRDGRSLGGFTLEGLQFVGMLTGLGLGGGDYQWNTTKMQSDALMSRGAFRNRGGSAVAKAVGNPALGKAPARSGSSSGDSGEVGEGGSDGGDSAGSALLGVDAPEGSSSQTMGHQQSLVRQLTHALEQGDVIHAVEIMKMMATPFIVMGMGVSTVMLGAAIAAGAIPGGPVGAPAMAAGLFLIGIGVGEIDAGLAALNAIYGTDVQWGPLSSTSGGRP